MASVTITGPLDLLDSLTDALGAEPDFTLRRLGLDQLEASLADTAEFLVRMRVEGKLTNVARDWRHRAALTAGASQAPTGPLRTGRRPSDWGSPEQVGTDTQVGSGSADRSSTPASLEVSAGAVQPMEGAGGGWPIRPRPAASNS
jgi:hypothetical protein